MSCNTTQEFLQLAQGHTSVKLVNINSTMGKQYGACGINIPDCHILQNGCRAGLALIICSKFERDDWEGEFNHACHVLGQQFGLQVSFLSEVFFHFCTVLKIKLVVFCFQISW